MVKRLLLSFATLSVAGMFLLIDAAPASAHVDGGCTGSGDFEKGGFTGDAAEEGTINVPLADTVDWQGALPGALPGETPYSGKIEVELPPPFKPLKIDSWSGTSDSTGNSGEKKYDLPSAMPRGVEFEVKGSHTQGPFNCSGHVTVVVQGGKFGPVTIASLVGTALTGALFAFAGRPKVGG
jgi:hypothetical protein